MLVKRKECGYLMLWMSWDIHIMYSKGDWGLICVGNGELRNLLDNVPGIEVIDFVNQDRLVEITKRSGVFILPSRFDQWGVVIHEFASAGMPLILSDNVGARAMFMVEGFNGMTFRRNSSIDLAKTMYNMSLKKEAELIQMSRNSHSLSKRLCPEQVAASFLSVINQ